MDVATGIGQNIGHQVDCHSTYQRNSSHLDRWLILLEKSTTCMRDGLGTSLPSSLASDHRVIPQVLLRCQLQSGRTAWHHCCTHTHTAYSTVLPSLVGQWKDLLQQSVGSMKRKHKTMPSTTRDPTGGPILHTMIHPPTHPKCHTNIRMGKRTTRQQDSMVATQIISPT